MSKLSKKELSRLSSITPRGGDLIDNVVREMVRRANTYNIRVNCVFNDTEFTVNPGMTIGQALRLWREERERRGQKWQKSMKAEIYRREGEAIKERGKASAKHGQDLIASGKLQVPLFKRPAFNKFVRVHSSSELDKLVVDYAMAWGIAMQNAMRRGQKIADVADKLSQEVDNGMSGYSHNLAIKILCEFWKHGEELRRWHNSQFGDQGKLANKDKKAVINPTIIRVSGRKQ